MAINDSVKERAREFLARPSTPMGNVAEALTQGEESTRVKYICPQKDWIEYLGPNDPIPECPTHGQQLVSEASSSTPTSS